MKRPLSLALLFIGCSTLVFGTTEPETVNLNQALAAALSSGPEIEIARLTLNNAADQRKAAAAKDGFSLGTTTGYTHRDTFGSAGTTSFAPAAIEAGTGESVDGALALTGPSTSATVKAGYGVADAANPVGTHRSEATLSLSVSRTLFDGYPGGRAKASYEQGQYAYRLAQVGFDAAKDNIIYNVEQAYYTMLGAQRTVRLRRAMLNQSKEDLARTNAFFNAKQLTTLDVLTSRIVEQTARADLDAAEDALKQTRSSLAVLLGRPIDRQFSAAEAADPSVPSLGEPQAVQTAFEKRSGIKRFEIRRAEANVGLKSAESRRMPVVAVNGSVGYDIYPGVSPNIDSGTWNAGVTVSVPILDSGLVSAQIAQARDRLLQLGIQEAQAKQNITIDVRRSLFAVKDASVRLSLAKERVKQAQDEYELQKTEFGAGLSSNLDVINASVTLANAQVALETARTKLNLAILNLHKAMGTLSADGAGA